MICMQGFCNPRCIFESVGKNMFVCLHSSPCEIIARLVARIDPAER